ncbi:MAG TPA: nuclear transport factor 2 family protein [Vicinamibacterales bacterium]|nr:nuclear transport factor 2 family protein [Vicinamibacterales bacterium]
MNTQQDYDFLENFAKRWLEAWNSHETDRVLELLHPDIEWDDQTFWTKVQHGHAEVRNYIDKIWAVMHDVRFEEMQTFFARDRLRGLVLFRQFGSAPKNLPGCKPFDTHGCDIFLEFRDGKLSHYLASYDIVGMMCQMGALPARGNKVGGAYLLSLASGGK